MIERGHSQPTAHLVASSREHEPRVAVGHSVEFYEDDAALIEGLSRFIGAALGAGDAAVVVATEPHREELARRLGSHGLDLGPATAEHRYVALDAAEVLSRIVVNGAPDALRFTEVMGEVIARAASAATGEAPRVAAFGEMVALLWSDDNAEAAIQLERCWNDLAKRQAFDLHCAYPIGLFPRYGDVEQIARVCAEHERVLPAESYRALTDEDERLRAIALLQQKAQALETEVKEKDRLLAMEQAMRLLAEEEARVIETLHHVGETVAVELELPKVVQAVTDAATALSDAQVGAFLYNLPDDQGEAYTLQAITGAPREDFAQFPMRGTAALVASTFDGQGVIRLDDLSKDPRYGYTPPDQGPPNGHLPVRSYLAVPVVSRSGEVLGGLFFGHEQVGVFTEQAERMVVGIASQAAIAIDNARLYRQAQEAVTKREEFLSVAAHELKTPITSLRMATQVLLRQLTRNPAGDLDHLPQMLKVMELQSDKLAQLISQLLDISRLDAGRLMLNRSEVDLVEIVRSVVERTKSLVSKHSFAVSGLESACLSLDPLRIEQVIVNLVNNAVKYSPDGGTVEVEITQPGPTSVQVAVRDYGIGIEPGQEERIFDRFYRIAEGEYTTGLGLGLYISRQITEHHGGRLWAECPPDGGSRVSLSLPIRAARRSAPDLRANRPKPLRTLWPFGPW